MLSKIMDLISSRTNIIGILTAIAGVASFFGVDLPLGDPDFQEKVVGALLGLGGILTVVFRSIATKKVGGGALE